jgi:hypothetical protein
MPYLDKPQVFYENIKDRKYDEIKAEILDIHMKTLESKIYPHNVIYPTRK